VGGRGLTGTGGDLGGQVLVHHLGIVRRDDAMAGEGHASIQRGKDATLAVEVDWLQYSVRPRRYRLSGAQ
jgi:hypothetical protein